MKIFIEGNIASGKSTLVHYLKDNLQLNVIPEPIDKWKNTVDNKGNNILQYFYNDTKRWGYLFQMNAFLTRGQIIEKNKDNDFIMERSIYSDKNCFAINCYENNLISDIEWKLYNSWFTWLSKSLSLEGDAYIYLRTSPEISFKRLKKRNRKEEELISLEYLKEIHNRHEKWLYKKSNNILILDGNIENSKERLLNFKKQIQHFIKKIRLSEYNKNKE